MADRQEVNTSQPPERNSGGVKGTNKMSKDSIPVPPAERVEAAQNVLWYYTGGGWQPGSFTENLIRAMDSADYENLDRFAFSFPALTWAVFQAKHVDGGLDTLREIAAGGGN